MIVIFLIFITVLFLEHMSIIYYLLNGGASFRWSFGPHSAWSSIESTTILTPHSSLLYHIIFYDLTCEPPLYLWAQNRSRLTVTHISMRTQFHKTGFKYYMHSVGITISYKRSDTCCFAWTRLCWYNASYEFKMPLINLSINIISNEILEILIYPFQ